MAILLWPFFVWDQPHLYCNCPVDLLMGWEGTFIGHYGCNQVYGCLQLVVVLYLGKFDFTHGQQCTYMAAYVPQEITIMWCTDAVAYTPQEITYMHQEIAVLTTVENSSTFAWQQALKFKSFPAVDLLVGVILYHAPQRRYARWPPQNLLWW